MELQRELTTSKRVSWGSILAGVVTVLAVSMLLTTLGASLGFALLSPQSDDVTNGAGTAMIVWSLLSIVVSLAAGAFITGRLAAVDGAIHGFLLWATSLIIATILGAAALGGLINTAGNIAGGIVSTTGNIVGGLGSVAGDTAEGAMHASGDIAKQLGLDTKLKSMNLDDHIVTALRKSKIKELQPEYLQSELQAAGNDVAVAAKKFVTNPDDSDAIASKLAAQLKQRGESVSAAVDKNKVKKALTENTNLSPEQADKAVDNFISARDQAVKQVNQRLDQLEDKLNQAKGQYAEFKHEALQAADNATSTGAKVTLWSFIGLLLGAIVSTLAGLWGVNTHPGRKTRA
jgi:hypothetical protein